jgi:hypothetical protein
MSDNPGGSGSKGGSSLFETLAVVLAAIALFTLFFGAFLLAPLAILLLAGGFLILNERSGR